MDPVNSMLNQTYLDSYGEWILSKTVLPIGLTTTEMDLLESLVVPALNQAPAFADAFLRRTKSFTTENLPAIANGMLADTLEAWFGGLFQVESAPTSVSRSQHQGLVHRPTGVFLRDMFASLDIILSYGREVTRKSIAPEQAQRAFQKQLALDLMISQIQGDQYLVRLVAWALSD